MARTLINFRIDEDLKLDLEEICEDMGMSLSTAFTIFAKKLARERKIPFEINSDPFYSKKNMERLEKSIEQLEKTGGTVHNITIDGVDL